MRLVTRCPACETAFYVTHEQLAAYRGDVRCGKCELIFSALDRLSEVPDAPVAELAPVSLEPDQSHDLEQASYPDLTENLDQNQSDVQDQVLSDDQDKTEISHDAAIENESTELTFFIQDSTPETSIPAETNDIPDAEIHEEIEIRWESTETPEPTIDERALPVDDDRVQIADTPLPEVTEETVEEVIILDTPTSHLTDYAISTAGVSTSPAFLDDVTTRQDAPRGGHGRKWLIGLLIVVLLIAAVFQAIYFLRSDIAARMPQFRPHLEQACAWLGCRVELPRIADKLLIDDSELREDADRQGLIHFHSTLVNTADFTQAFPMLELTLTDNNDKPIVRRTLKPTDYVASSADIKRGLSAHQQIEIRLPISIGNEPVAGYRIFVTY